MGNEKSQTFSQSEVTSELSPADRPSLDTKYTSEQKSIAKARYKMPQAGVEVISETSV